MTREETIKLLMIIQATFPNFKVEDKSTTVDAWLMMLKEYNVNDVYLAFKSYCKSENSGFAPSVSQLINQIEKPRELAVMDDAEAWALVRKAIGRSSYNSQAEFDKLSPTLQKAVGSPEVLRTWAIDENYNESVISSQFLRNYRSVCQRQQEFNRLPVEMQNRVEEFIEKVPQIDTNTLLIGSLEPNLDSQLEPEPIVSDYTERLKEKWGME